VKVLKILGATLGALVVLAALAWLFRSNPIGPISGRAVTGTVAAYPGDWSFSDEHSTIAVEVRPEAPHSVTTICFIHDGALYVPAQSGSTKDWTRYVVADPRVRLKIGDRVFEAVATRIEDADPETFLASAGKKYPQVASQDEIPEDIWLFRIGPRES
jgi:hypothetical protein